VTNLGRDVGKADSSLLTISVQFHLAWLRHLLEFNARKLALFVHFARKPFARNLESSRWFVYLFIFPLCSATRIFESIDIHFLSFNWFLKSTIYCQISRTSPDMQISFFRNTWIARVVFIISLLVQLKWSAWSLQLLLTCFGFCCYRSVYSKSLFTHSIRYPFFPI